MRLLNRQIKCLVTLILFLFCGCEKPETLLNASLSTGTATVTLPANTLTTFDYTQISSHPRLLLKAGEESKILANIQANPDLKKVHDAIINKAISYLSQPVVAYALTGKRLLPVSREALQRIFYLSYAFRLTGTTTYKDRAIQEMLNVCSFANWNPTHFLDVGEMSMGVAIGYDWLYNQISAANRATIRTAIKNLALVPSKDSKLNYLFLSNDNNWNQVCHGGLLGAALAIFEDNQVESTEIVDRYLVKAPIPLAAYGPDGNYTEGYTYWGYGTTFQTMGLTMLETALGSDKGLSQTPGFLNTGEYFYYMTGSTSINLPFNYSDSDDIPLANAAMFYFAKKTNQINNLFTEKKLLQGNTYLRNSDELRYLPLTLIFTKDLDINTVVAPTKKIWVGNGDNPVAMVKLNSNDVFNPYLAVKGGRANNSHGHMDAGSFIFDVLGQRWAVDLGLQSYGSLEGIIDLWNLNQNSTRWSAFRLNNFSHNTITVNSKPFIVTGFAGITQQFTTNINRLGIRLKMTDVIGTALKSAYREVTLIDQKTAQIIDDVETNSNAAIINWNMVTTASATVLNSNTIELTQNGKKVRLIVDLPCNNLVMKITSGQGSQAYDAANPNALRVGFDYSMPPNTITRLKVRLVPQN
jgi:hypothetical protein